MRILLWHVHGGWTDAFVRGGHDLLLPTLPGGGPWGLGRGGREWPPTAREVAVDRLRDEQIDVVVLQRPEEYARVAELTGRRAGSELPTVYLEHNTPGGAAVTSRHPFADRDDLVIVHVTHFNRLVWDTGSTRTAVIEHGVPDRGAHYRGELERMSVVVNEPVRRWRVVGADLLPSFARAGEVDVFGMGTAALTERLGTRSAGVRPAGELSPGALHAALAERRLYLHLTRWTSLGLSLIEAMSLGVPVVALQTTEAARAVPPGAGFVSTDVDELVAAARTLLADHELAVDLGRAARRAALERYGLGRFQADWDRLLADVVEGARRTGRHEPLHPAHPPVSGRSDHAHRDDL